MKQYDAIVIGFGKGGKTLSGALAGAGKRVALIEKSDKIRETMYQRAGKIAGNPATLYLKSASFILHFLAPPQNKNAPNPQR